MVNMNVIVWIFPVLFIFHDLEELTFLKSWINRNNSFLAQKFPKMTKRVLPHFSSITNFSFALGVIEELIIIIIVTLISFLTQKYYLWTGLFIAFTFHLMIHCIQTLVIKKYVPAIATSVILLPVCIYIIWDTAHLFILQRIIQFSIIGLLIMAVNIIAVHKGMDIIYKFHNK